MIPAGILVGFDPRHQTGVGLCESSDVRRAVFARPSSRHPAIHADPPVRAELIDILGLE